MSCSVPTEHGMTWPWLWSTWAKAPRLRGADVVIAAACLPFINPGLLEELARGKVVLLACPEREHPALYGKLASIVRSTKPKSLIIVSIDGSPHCMQLHAAANEAEYILGEELVKEHYVVVDAKDLRRISPETIRVARYLSLVEDLVKERPGILGELEKLSLEHRAARKRIKVKVLGRGEGACTNHERANAH